MEEHLTGLFELVGRLGVERRRALRILLPKSDFQIYPTFKFSDQQLQAFDLSVGGCCLLDPSELLGPQIGQEFKLTVCWPGSEEQVRSRIVARVDNRRHIQFLDLRTERLEEIKFLVAPAARGQSLRPLIHNMSEGPSLEAREIWNSLQGDNVIIENHLHRVAQVGIFGVQYTLFKESWPVRDGGTPLTRDEVISLALFICNIPNPSSLLTEILQHLEKLSMKGAV